MTTLWDDPDTWDDLDTWDSELDEEGPPPVFAAGTDIPSTGNPTATITTEVVGIWLIEGDYVGPSEVANSVKLLGQDDSPADIGEVSETLYPVGRQAPVYEVDTVRGYEGSVSGVATSRQNRLQILAWKQIPGLRLRLVMGDMNIPVQLGKIRIGRYPTELGFYTVALEVSQIDEFDVAGQRS